MSAANRIRIYEQISPLDVVDAVIRPGGLALTDHALAFCDLPAGARVVDIGCGRAASVEHLRAHHSINAVGLDPSAVLLRAGHQRHAALPLLQAQGEYLPVGTNQLDAVLAECSLSVMENPNQALAEFWRVLRTGGYLVLSDLYARAAADRAALAGLPIASCLCGAVPRAEVIRRVEAQGFHVCQWEDHTPALNAFAARLIWTYGSMQQFWCSAASCTSTSAIQAAVAQIKPGYYLLIARKDTC